MKTGDLPDGAPPPYKDTWTHALQLANGGTELRLCDDINDLIRMVRLADMKEVPDPMRWRRSTCRPGKC